MKAISVAAILLLAGSAASAQTTEELNNDGRNTDNILTYGMGYHQQRYSRLKDDQQEHRQAAGAGLEPQPRQPVGRAGAADRPQRRHVRDQCAGTRSRSTSRTGKQIWRHTLDWPAETPRVVCCGVSNKGAAIFDGKIFRTTLDAHVIALDAKTGKEIWKSKADEWKDGFSMTLAPLIANGVLITGMSGAEFGIRGYIDGWDPQTGKRLWRTYTIPAPRREGQRDLAAGQRRLEGRRRIELDHRLLRSRARPHLLGHRQSGAVGLAEPQGRQPLYVVRARHAAEDRRDRLALPVHAERPVRLRRQLGADQRRHRRERPAAQGDHAAQPQRLPLRDRPHQRAS